MNGRSRAKGGCPCPPCLASAPVTCGAARQVVRELAAKDVEELVGEDDVWLLAFFQGAGTAPGTGPDSLRAMRIEVRMRAY